MASRRLRFRPLRHLLYFFLLLSASHATADFGARVVAVHDGDTLTVLVSNRQVRVRLIEIDAPELGQPFGMRSKQSLAELCFGKQAQLDTRSNDRYGRTLAHVTCAGQDANAEQVRRGYAWIYVRYAAPDSPLHALEREARVARRGLWGDSMPVAPWDWRRNGRRASLQRTSPVYATLPGDPATRAP